MANNTITKAFKYTNVTVPDRTYSVAGYYTYDTVSYYSCSTVSSPLYYPTVSYVPNSGTGFNNYSPYSNTYSQYSSCGTSCGTKYSSSSTCVRKTKTVKTFHPGYSYTIPGYSYTEISSDSGWTSSSALSYELIGDVGGFSFSSGGTNSGVVTGLTDPATASGGGYHNIQFAFFITGDKYYIMESGVKIGNATNFGTGKASDRVKFEVRRTGSTIEYFVEDSLVYTSLASPTTTLMTADISLYEAGDAVYNATLSTSTPAVASTLEGAGVVSATGYKIDLGLTITPETFEGVGSVVEGGWAIQDFQGGSYDNYGIAIMEGVGSIEAIASVERGGDADLLGACYLSVTGGTVVSVTVGAHITPYIDSSLSNWAIGGGAAGSPSFANAGISDTSMQNLTVEFGLGSSLDSLVESFTTTGAVTIRKLDTDAQMFPWGVMSFDTQMSGLYSYGRMDMYELDGVGTLNPNYLDSGFGFSSTSINNLTANAGAYIEYDGIALLDMDPFISTGEGYLNELENLNHADLMFSMDLYSHGGGQVEGFIAPFVATATGTVAVVGRLDAALSPFTLTATGRVGAVAGLQSSFGLEIVARGTVGVVGEARLDIAYPMSLLARGGQQGLDADISYSFEMLAEGTVDETINYAMLEIGEFVTLDGRLQTSMSNFVLAAIGTQFVVQTGTAYALNIENKAVTRHDVSFDRVIKFGGTYYGVRSDGFYALGAGDDDGTAIDATVRLHGNSFEKPFHKRITDAYMSSTTDDQMTVKPICDTREGLATQTHTLATADRKRAKLNRGFRGTYWGFEIKNVNGGQMNINDLELHVEDIARRI